MMAHTSKIIQCLILTKTNIDINLTIKLFYVMSFIFLLLYERMNFCLSYLFVGATEIIQKLVQDRF